MGTWSVNEPSRIPFGLGKRDPAAAGAACGAGSMRVGGPAGLHWLCLRRYSPLLLSIRCHLSMEESDLQSGPCYNDRRYSDILFTAIFSTTPNQLPYKQRYYDISLPSALISLYLMLTFLINS
jgi:hypothetical protein